MTWGVVTTNTRSRSLKTQLRAGRSGEVMSQKNGWLMLVTAAVGQRAAHGIKILAIFKAQLQPASLAFWEAGTGTTPAVDNLTPGEASYENQPPVCSCLSIVNV